MFVRRLLRASISAACLERLDTVGVLPVHVETEIYEGRAQGIAG